MEIIAYIFALIIGLVMGILGGGGSILTVPVLVYLMHIPAYNATSYSLFIVGVTSLVGTLNYLRQKLVDIKTAILFSIPSFVGVFLTRKFLLPIIPEELLSLNGFMISKDVLILVIFSILMFFASIAMIRKNNTNVEDGSRKSSDLNLIAKFFFIGVLLGFVGAGGGFMIIPSLIFFANLSIKEAIGTSLLIIASNTLVGFAGDLMVNLNIDWNFLFLFASISVAGVLIGTWISKFIPSNKLKPAFGWFVLVMSIYILIRELFFQ